MDGHIRVPDLPPGAKDVKCLRQRGNKMEEIRASAEHTSGPRWRARFIDYLSFGQAIEEILLDSEGREIRIVVRDGYGNILFEQAICNDCEGEIQPRR